MKKATNWEEISYIISSKYRYSVLRDLESPKTPSKLSKELDINKTHISRALSELESKKAVQCLTPKAKKGKLYVITKHGKEILDKAKDLK